MRFQIWRKRENRNETEKTTAGRKRMFTGQDYSAWLRVKNTVRMPHSFRKAMMKGARETNATPQDVSGPRVEGSSSSSRPLCMFTLVNIK